MEWRSQPWRYKGGSIGAFSENDTFNSTALSWDHLRHHKKKKKKSMELPQGGNYRAELLKCIRLPSYPELPFAGTPKAKKSLQCLGHPPEENKAHIFPKVIFPRKALSLFDKESAFGLLKAQVWEAPLSAVISHLCHGWMVFQYLSHISRAQ